MTDKMKNIITNIIGLIFVALAIYGGINEFEIYNIVVFVVIGLMLFLFKNDKLQSVLSSFLPSKISKKTVDPDREKPDERG